MEDRYRNERMRQEINKEIEEACRELQAEGCVVSQQSLQNLLTGTIDATVDSVDIWAFLEERNISRHLPVNS